MSTLEVNTITPQSGTTLTLGGSGDTINLGSGASGSGFGIFETQLFHVVDEQSGDGGTFSGGTQTRVLNTIRTNEITGASLSSNQITLPSGTYFIDSLSVAFLVGRHQAKLRNTSDSSDVLFGSVGHTSDGSGIGQNPSIVTGRFTIASSKVFEIQHSAEYTRNGNGFGISASSNNIYTDCRIWKVA